MEVNLWYRSLLLCASCLVSTAPSGQSEQQSELAIEQGAGLLGVDLPAPRIRNIQGAADLAGAAMGHVVEPLRITATAEASFCNIVHDATRRAFDLICSVRAVLAELRADGTQGTNQFQCNGVCSQHVLLESLCYGKGNALPPTTSAAGLRPSRPI